MTVCAKAISASVYSGADNIIRLVLIADGDVLRDLSAVTRVTVTVTDENGVETLIDSDVVGGSVIWWTDQQDYRGSPTDVLSLQLGDQGLAAGSYPKTEIKIYDAIYTNGLMVENDLKLTVYD